MGGTYFAYIAICHDGSYYIGITNDLVQRENRHNAGVGSTYTSKKRPLRIVYSETFDTRTQAARREKQLKGWTRKKKESLINGTLKNHHENLTKKTTKKIIDPALRDQ